MHCVVHKNNVVNSKLSLNSSQGGQKVPWIGTSLSYSRASHPSQQWPGTQGSVSYSHVLAPLLVPMGFGRVSSLSLLELSNSLCSSFHKLQDDHKLSNEELENKYQTNIVTVSHEGTQIRSTSPITVKKKVCGKLTAPLGWVTCGINVEMLWWVTEGSWHQELAFWTKALIKLLHWAVCWLYSSFDSDYRKLWSPHKGSDACSLSWTVCFNPGVQEWGNPVLWSQGLGWQI